MITPRPDPEQFAEELASYISSEVALDDPADGEGIAGDTDLLLSGLVDSLGVVMVSEWVQERLDIVIEPVDIVLEHFQTVNALVGYAGSREALAR